MGGTETIPVETYTAEQEAALQAVVDAFGIIHSRCFSVELKVYNGRWTEAEVNPSKKLYRGNKA